MVSSRCKLAVKEVLRTAGLHFVVVDLGEVEIMEELNAEERISLALALQKSGLELMPDKKAELIVEIKKTIIELIDNQEGLTKINFSDYLSKKLNQQYTNLSTIFSEF